MVSLLRETMNHEVSLSSTLSYREEKESAFLDNLSLRGVVHEPAITVRADTTTG